MVKPPTRLRSRLTSAPKDVPADATLRLNDRSARTLTSVSGGRPEGELAAIATAAILVLAGAEHTDEPVLTVASQDRRIVVQAAVTECATIGDLLHAIDQQLRDRAGGDEREASDGLSVSSVRVTEHPAAETGPVVEVWLDADADADGRPLLRARGRPDIAEPWFLAVLLRAIDQVLAAVGEPGTLLADLRAWAEDDVATAVQFGRGAFSPDVPESTLIAPIQAMVARHGSQVAVEAAGAAMTYQELWLAAERVASRLAAHGVGAGDRVAVLTGKSIHAVPAIIGTLLAGAAYVPLDDEWSAARLTDILADAQCKVVLAAGAGLRGVVPPGEHCVDLEALAAERAALPGFTPAPPSPQTAAYVIYTSGSTGAPKGVQVRHGAIASYLRWKVGFHELTPSTRLLQIPSLAFDSSVSDIFSVLSSGGRIVLVTANQILPRELAALIGAHRITHMTLVPSLYRTVLNELPTESTPLRLVTVAGEPVPPALVSDHWSRLPEVRLVNEYGPTENSVGATAFDHRPSAGPGCPIGRPLTNTVVLVTSDDGRPKAPGLVGEIRLAGPGLADGYRNSPELDAAKFAPDPSLPGGRAYRTGDLGWWRLDGILEFAGRIDDQVKIRGHRVEPGEVEAALTRIEGVAGAAVAAVADGGSSTLVAFVEAPGLAGDAVRDAASAALSGALMPSRFEIVEKIPRLVSGKPDRQALRERALSEQALRQLAAADPAARTELVVTELVVTELVVTELVVTELVVTEEDDIEQVVAGSFARALGRPSCGPDDDFFMLGGHSLLAMSVLNELEKHFGTPLDLDEFFDFATVRALADQVAKAREGAAAGGRGARAPVAPVTPLEASDSLRHLRDAR